MIGKMRDRILVQENIRIPVPGAGGISSWQTVLDVWANVKPLSSRGTLQDNQSTMKNAKTFTIRFIDGMNLTPEMRVLHEGAIYTINSDVNVNERDRFIQFNAYANGFPVS